MYNVKHGKSCVLSKEKDKFIKQNLVKISKCNGNGENERIFI